MDDVLSTVDLVDGADHSCVHAHDKVGYVDAGLQ
jgi:hypothetical protein